MAWLLTCLLFTPAVSAEMGDSDLASVRQIKVLRSKSRTLTLNTPIGAAVVGNPEIADALPMSDKVLYIQGKKAGTTNVSIFSPDKKLIQVIDIDVGIDADVIADKIHNVIGATGIHVSASREQIVLSGIARSAEEADQAMQLVKGYTPETPIVNLIKIAQAQQVLLKVRFLEVNRSAGRDLGVNYYAANSSRRSVINTGTSTTTTETAGSGIPLAQTLASMAGASGAPAITGIASLGKNMDVVISALESKGLVRELAEPDLVALSGDTASFLAGGEVPVPVVQPSSGSTPTITVDYKQFGVQLTFLPTVLANGVINLRLTPSVSELDYTNAVQNQGFLIPALTKREARTTIELRDGQSFAIAGLLQSKNTRNIAQTPWIGSVPVLGALFRSSAYQQNETDLVVIVTPHLIAPIAPGQRIVSPLDQKQPSNDTDFFLLGQTEVPKKQVKAQSQFVTTVSSSENGFGHIMPKD